MPTSTGQYQFADFKAELRARGFSAFADADLGTYINRGYFHVAARSRWYWEEGQDSFHLDPGSFSVLVGEDSVELNGFQSLDKLFCTTAGQTRRMIEMSDEEFFNNWMPFDLTQTQYQGEPSNYYLFNNQLYILAPPNAGRDFMAYYHRDVVPLVIPTDVPLTPHKFDEAILYASLARCHQRSSEPTLVALAEQQLQEIFDDMADEEETRIGEHYDRVKPDDTWL